MAWALRLLSALALVGIAGTTPAHALSSGTRITWQGRDWFLQGANVKDGAGRPTGINGAVYADFDAALQLADKYDLYYDFVLFSAPTAIPHAWLTDTPSRAQLGQVLGGLFAHYKDNPRVDSISTSTRCTGTTS